MKKHDPDFQPLPVPSKVCGGPCGKRLPLTDYHVNNNRPDKRHLYCKTCTKAMVYAQRENVREYRSRQHLIRMRRAEVAP